MKTVFVLFLFPLVLFGKGPVPEKLSTDAVATNLDAIINTALHVNDQKGTVAVALQLMQFQDDKAWDALRALLVRTQDTYVTMQIAKRLIDMEDPRKLMVVRAVLDNPGKDCQKEEALIMECAREGHPFPIDLVKNYTHHPDSDVRRAVAFFYGRSSDPRSLDSLLAMTAETDRNVLASVLYHLSLRPSPVVRDVLLGVLDRNPDSATQAKVIEMLAPYGRHPKVEEQVGRALASADGQIRAAAIASWKFMSSFQFEKLVEFIDDPDSRVAEAAYRVVKGVEGELGINRDLDLLKSGKSPRLRIMASDYLLLSNDPRAVAPLIESATSDNDPDVRVSAVRALGCSHFDIRAVAESLIGFMHDSNSSVRERAFQSLQNLLFAIGQPGAENQDVHDKVKRVLAKEAHIQAKDRFTKGNKTDPAIGTLFQKAADLDDPLAFMWLAKLQADGYGGFPQDEGRARQKAGKVFVEVVRLAETNDPEAQFLLSFAYQRGMGTETNDLKNIEWLAKAAGGGDLIAMNNWGNVLLSGKGAPRDESQAVSWYRKAAEAGNVSAMGNLGSCYHWGMGTKPDLEEAARWYKLGLTGNDSLKSDLDMLKPISSRHLFKAAALIKLPYVALFSLPEEDLHATALRTGVVPAGTRPPEKQTNGRFTCLAYPGEGIMFPLRYTHVWVAELYDENVKGFNRFRGELPLGLEWSDTREKVMSKLGMPDDSGSVSDEDAYGMAYEVDNMTLAVMFWQKGSRSIKLVRIYARWAE